MPRPRTLFCDQVQELARLEALSFEHPWSPASLDAHIKSKYRTTLLRPYGYVLGQLVAHEVELLRIGVPPAFRRRGHGRQLLQDACCAWRSAGATKAFLEVSVNNLAAIQLYLADGWKETGLRRAYYPDGADAQCFGRSL